LYWVSALLSQLGGKHYFISATKISGKTENTEVTVYSLINNKIEKLYSTRIDSITDIGTLQHNIDSDTAIDWYIRYYQKNGYSDIKFYSGEVEKSIQPIGSYSICQRTFVSSISISDGTPQNGVALSGSDGSCFRIVKLLKLVGVVGEEQPDKSSLSFVNVSPVPIETNGIVRVKFIIPLQGEYRFSLYDLSGRNIGEIVHKQYEKGANNEVLLLSKFMLSSGIYTLRLSSKDITTSTTIIAK